MAVKLSIIIPTLGRESLADTLASCADADEIVVVLDTVRGGKLPCRLPDNAVFAEKSFGVTGGHAGRAYGISLATGTHLAFFDDDDEYTPGAVEIMRAAATDVPVIFRMDHYAHGVIWKDREIRFGNVSTQMYLVPNQPEKFGSWTPHVPGLKEPGGDYTFIKETCERMGGPVWRREVTSVIRPEEPRAAALSVVTAWWGHPGLAEDYLAVLERGRWPHGVIVIDNGGAPELPDVRVVAAGSNLGFSRACNLGLSLAETDAVLFLNNDVRQGKPGWLDEIRSQLEPGVLVGPLRYDAHADVDGVSLPYIDGWCLAGMTADLRELGGFRTDLDEPAYYSDNLLCLEARAAGMILREARPGIEHLENVTAGSPRDERVQAASSANRDRYQARARELLVV